MTEATYKRIQALRDSMLGEREISLCRPRLIMESYSETEGEPVPIRRAKALRKILNGLPLYIGRDELLVGRLTDKTRGCVLTPELSEGKFSEATAALSGTMLPIPEEAKKELREIDKYWSVHPMSGGVKTVLPEEYAALPGIVAGFGPGTGHHSIGYEKILGKGAAGLISEIDAELSKTGNSEEKIISLQASKIALTALIELAGRYAKYAGELAEKESDARRRAELEEIKDICSRVPAHPARSFHEAMQSIWFTNMALLNEEWSVGIGFMRFDQYMLPFYRADV
jgi:pyruvate-formate lyase